MFCSKCGAQIEDGAKFCSSCGTVVEGAGMETASNGLNSNAAGATFAGTNSIASLKKEVTIKGSKWYINRKYQLFVDLFPLIGLFLAYISFQHEFIVIGSIFLIAFFVFEIITRKIFKQSILYDDSKKAFLINENSHLNFAKREIKLSELKEIKIRNVKVSAKSTKAALKNNIFVRSLLPYGGKYSLVAFNTQNFEEGLEIYFSKKGNIEELLPLLEKVIKTNQLNITLDKKDEIIDWADYANEYIKA